MKKINSLRKKGHRITSQREFILKKLEQTPQTAEQIYSKINKQADLASVYRTLSLFVKNEIVKEIDFGDGKKRYEILDDKNHHHHFICNNCKSVEDIKLELESKLISDLQTKSKIKIEDHSIELFGLCRNCS